jgi:deazaflavin-dependent oxidoreductase (nitroreductase family)
MLVLNTIGSKSGEPRRAILNFSRDGGDYVVAGSKGGAPTDPAWVANLAANPTATVEAEGRRFQATARVEREGSERDRLWAGHVRTLPKFADYPEKSGRVIPMVRLRPTTSA